MYKAAIIDDEKWALDHLVVRLDWDNYGFTIEYVFTDPLEALEKLRKNICDVVLLDFRMPNMTGLELLDAFKKKGMDIEFVITSS